MSRSLPALSDDLYLKGKPYRIMIIRPPAQYQSLSFPDGPRVGLPLGPLYLASLFTREMGIETELLDALVHADLRSLGRGSPPYFFGLPVGDIVERATRFRPDLVAISSNFGFFLENAVDTIAALRHALPGVFIVAGGADVSAQPEEYLRRAPGLDCAVLGEGEVVLKNLVGRLRNERGWQDVRGLAFRGGDEIVRTPDEARIYDLDRYKIDYSKIDMEAYFRLYEQGYPARISYEYPGSHRAVSMVTSRGCPYKCIFCSIQVHMGHAFRWHSAEYVVDELRRLVTEHDVRHIHFEDDNLTLHRPRFKKILRGIIDGGLRLTWDTPNGVRADLLDRELIQLAKQSGCVYLMFGVESGSQRVVDEVVKKDMDLGRIREAARLCHEEGLDTAAFYIIGFPGETLAEIQQTYDLAFEMFTRYRTRPHFNIARPLKGTELYRIAQQQNLFVDTDSLESGAREKIPKVLLNPQMIETEHFSLDDLSRIFLRYQRNFLRQAILNWVKAAARDPARSARSMLGLVLDLLSRPREAKVVAYRYFVRKFIFPHALGRDFAAADRPASPVQGAVGAR